LIEDAEFKKELSFYFKNLHKSGAEFQFSPYLISINSAHQLPQLEV